VSLTDPVESPMGLGGSVARLAELFVRARRPVVFTGAPLDARADLVIRGRAAEVLPAVRERVGA